MLRFFVVGCLILMAEYTQAAGQKMERLKVGSEVYSNVTIVGASSTDLYFTYEKGIKNVKLRYLEPEMQKLFHYDPKAAFDAERQQTEEDTRYQGTLAATISRNAAQAARAVTNEHGRISSEDSFVDAISDRSAIGKPGPPLEIEKWFGPPPLLKGKFVLLSFWAPWSIPCRKYIPQLNALQKKFADKLQIVGLVSENEAEAEPVEPRIEFASAMDLKGKLHAAAGITTLPCVLLMDPAGTVLYEGHPAALNEKQLQAILAKAPAEEGAGEKKAR